MTDLPETTFFDIRRDGAVVDVRLNRPDKANGMTPAFWAELPAVVRALDDDLSVRALVISGAGKHFSGGMDLASFQNINALLTKEPGRAAYALRKLILGLQDTFNALENSRLPVVAAIHGACIGGAVDLITACDIRVASEDAKFSIEEINIGMAADVGTLQRLPKLIPPGVVMELALTGRRFYVPEAMGWGLVNTVYADAVAVQQAAMDMAQDIAAKSPLAVAGTKKAVTYARDHSVADGLDQIATWNGGMLRSEDLIAAMGARMARKEAVFADLLAAGIGGTS